MKLRISTLLVSTTVALATATLPAQTDSAKLNQLHDQWNAVNKAPAPKDYTAVIKALEAYSKTPGGRSWIIDYWLGSSYCSTPGMHAKGLAALNRALRGKDITPDGITAADTVQKSCSSTTAAGQDQPAFQLISISGLQAAGYSGKAGFRTLSGTEHVSQTQLSTVSIDDLHARIFPATQSAGALKATTERAAPPSLQAAITDGILVATDLSVDPADVGACLVRYRTPMLKQFDMKSPSSLITTYAVFSQQVPDLAAKLHGISMPLGTVAYSVYEDLSIVGTGSGTQCGSLAHELMHLSIRQNFGDAPAWLEEGLASEIAVALPAPDKFQFLKSWRDEELERDASIRPSVADLLQKRWPDYATSSNADVQKVAALHAMAAAFIRYLSYKGKLEPVYFAVRDTLNSNTPKSDEEILQSALAMNLTQIDADFDTWFKTPPADSSSPVERPAPNQAAPVHSPNQSPIQSPVQQYPNQMAVPPPN